MIRITRDEAAKLRQMGVVEKENGISRTSNHHHVGLYLCESKFNMSKLAEIRNGKTK